MLITLAFDFIVWAEPPERSALILAWLFIMTWGIGSLTLGTETLTRRGGGMEGVWRYVILTIGGAGAYGFMHWALLSAGRQGGAATSTTLLVFYMTVIGLVMVLWAAVLTLMEPAPEQLARRSFAVAYAAPFAVAVIAAGFLNVNEVRADIHYKQAWIYFHAEATKQQGQGNYRDAANFYDMAVAEYDTAIGLDPQEDYYRLFKGKAMLEKADTLGQALEDDIVNAGVDPGESEYEAVAGNPTLQAQLEARDRAFEAALDALNEALAANPLNTDHQANLGRAYQVWGDRTLDAERSAERLNLSSQAFAKAIEMSPNNPGLREELATTEWLKGDEELARAKIAEALAIDEEYGRPHRLLAMMARDDEDWETAATEYEQYVNSRDGWTDVSAWSGYAFALGRIKEHDEAIEANLRVLDLLRRDDLDTLRNLAILANEKGDRTSACSFAGRGLGVTDDAALRSFAEQLNCAEVGVQLPTTPGTEIARPFDAPPGATPTTAVP
jgi:tetratricopeptide (TPR) repeat protein